MVVAERLSIQAHGGDAKEFARLLGLNADILIDFSANINPFGPPAEILASVDASVAAVAAYPEIDAAPFIDSLAATLKIDADSILPGNGSADLLYWLFAWLRPRRVLLAEPGFADYRRAAEASGSEITTLNIRQEDDFDLDKELFESRAADVDAVVIGRPNNPTGRLVDGVWLSAMAARLPATVFLVDEAFIDFVDGALSLIRNSVGTRNLMVLRSLTKIFAIPGIRLGYLVGSSDIVSKMTLARPPWPLGCAQIAAGIAAAGLEGFVESSRSRLAQERRWLSAELKEMVEVEPLDGRANFILIKILSPKVTSTELMVRLAKMGFYIRDCRSFAGLSDRYFRIAVRTHEENIMLIDALREAL